MEHRKKTALAELLARRVRQLASITESTGTRVRLEPGPPQRYELQESVWRIAKGSEMFMRGAIRLRGYGLSRDELLMALENVRLALESRR
jgi:hypothetical protein